MEAIEQAKALLFAAGAEPVELKLAKVDDQLTLMVAYTTTLKADSREFAQLERRVALDLARLLPRLVSQPDALVLLSGSKEGAQGLTFIPAWAAVLWVNGQLTEEEFEETWQRQE
jgi:hypothetical protein